MVRTLAKTREYEGEQNPESLRGVKVEKTPNGVVKFLFPVTAARCLQVIDSHGFRIFQKSDCDDAGEEGAYYVRSVSELSGS